MLHACQCNPCCQGTGEVCISPPPWQCRPVWRNALVNSSEALRPTAAPTEVLNVGVELFGREMLQQILKHTDVTAHKDERYGGMVILHTPQGDRASWSGNELYKLQRINHTDSSVVVDIGGNIGDTAIQVYRHSPLLRSISIEPVAITYFYMLWNLHANSVPVLTRHGFAHAPGGVLPLFGGASSDGRNITMAYNTKHTKSSKTLRQGDWDRLQRQKGGSLWQQTTVPTHSVSRLLRALDRHARVALLKLECAHCDRLSCTAKLTRANPIDLPALVLASQLRRMRVRSTSRAPGVWGRQPYGPDCGRVASSTCNSSSQLVESGCRCR